MEEMREAAMAYHANLSEDKQKKLLKFYKSLDKDGDGKVTIHEYMDFLVRNGLSEQVPPNLFKLLDKDGGGTLDYEESVTLFYMFTNNRLVICGGCRSYLWGVHFLCVECYNANKKKTYELCCSCYRNRNFTHEHSSFKDNYALLRTEQAMDKLKKVVKGGAEVAQLAWGVYRICNGIN